MQLNRLKLRVKAQRHRQTVIHQRWVKRSSPTKDISPILSLRHQRRARVRAALALPWIPHHKANFRRGRQVLHCCPRLTASFSL